MNYPLISTVENTKKNADILSFGVFQNKQNNKKNEPEKNIIKKHIKLTKKKGEFSLNEHNNKNVIIDTDS